MEKIEFCFFDAGGGHRAAATALGEVVVAQKRPWNVELTNLQELLDELDVLKKYAGIRIQDFYNWMLRSGWTLGSEQLMRVLQLVIRLYHGPTVRMLERHWRETRPDMVVSFVPHFNRALRESFHRAFPYRPFVTILTDIADFPPHFWIEHESAETGGQFLVCGSDRAVEQAKSLGHSDQTIFRAPGMILNPKFYETPVSDRLAERERLGLKRDLPTGIVLFGGYGSQAMSEIAERLDRSSLQLQLIFICGKNERLAATLRNGSPRVPRFVEGFTKKVNYYMQLADFFIGKPGPGSISEALAMHLPVIVERNAWTLPQERYNCTWVVEKEVGIVLKSFKDIESAVAKIVDPATLSRYRANAQNLQNRAVFQIPDTLEQILSSPLKKTGIATS